MMWPATPSPKPLSQPEMTTACSREGEAMRVLALDGALGGEPAATGPGVTARRLMLMPGGRAEILLTNPAAVNREYTNLQQIEVLKGPQGSLYGRNAIAGAITIKLKEPTKDFSANVLAGYGNYHGFKTKVGDRLVPANVKPWEAVCDELNSMLLGWSPFLRGKVRAQAAANLKAFLARS